LGSDHRFFCYPDPDGFDLLLITLPVLYRKESNEHASHSKEANALSSSNRFSIPEGFIVSEGKTGGQKDQIALRG